MIRSYLFVPGDRPDLMRKALLSGADALILDLEDSVVPSAKPLARHHVQSFLDGQVGNGPRLFVRINALSVPWSADDVEMVRSAQPYGIVLPKAEAGDCVRRLVDLLKGTRVKIMPIVTETPRAVFGAGTYHDVCDDLHALTWGAEDLSSAVGAGRIKDGAGRYLPPYELARSLTLFGSIAAGVDAVETVYPDFKDLDGLRNYAQRGNDDGFSGMMAIHPSQVPIINGAFAPSDEEIAEARLIVDLFEASPEVGVLSHGGKMLDAPHLNKARRLLSRLA